MSIQRIAQPYVVYWKFEDHLEHVLEKWCNENLLNRYVVFVASHKENWLVELKAPVKHEQLGPTAVFMFDCPKDAMLFKLTWGG